MKKTKRLWALLLAMVMALGLISTAFAAPTIDSGRKASLSLYKYDITAASADGAWDAASYVSTGVQDDAVTDKLAQYAIQGVEFTYLRVADIAMNNELVNGQRQVGVLYGFAEDTILQAIGLTTADAYKSESGIRYYTSDKLNKALAVALADNATTVKNALEIAVRNGGKAMPETDENGHSKVSGLEQGLYLVVETRVPENVTSTCNPFFVSLPMTTMDGKDWNYDVTVYPKNQTGSPNLEKTVREDKNSTGKNGSLFSRLHSGFFIQAVIPCHCAEQAVHKLIVLIGTILFGQLHCLVDGNAGLVLAAEQHLCNGQTQHGQADARQTLHGPIAQMSADLVIHLCGMVVISIQQQLAEAIHRVLFVVFCMVGQSLCQRDVAKGLRKCQQKCILASFSTGQNVFHNIPFITGALPAGKPRQREHVLSILLYGCKCSYCSAARPAITRFTRLTVTLVMFCTADLTFSCTFSATAGMRAPDAMIRCSVSSAVPSRISTATGGWMLASSRSFSFLFWVPQETSATPSTSSAAHRAIFAMTSVEI